MLFRASLLLAFACLFAAPLCSRAAAQVSKLYPVDEAARDASFFAFRARLMTAVEQRDAAFVTSVVSPTIKNSFGGNDGLAEFKKYWRPERATSRLWSVLIGVLALGGSFDERNAFIAPYTFSKWPEEIDPFQHGVIVGEGVRVRERPALDSKVLAALSFDIVKVPDWRPAQTGGSKQRWIKVTLASGAPGYVAAEYIRSSIDYRAIFEKKDGRWVLTVLIAGD
ncbi:MAG TPA: SH3 domain-containing protein [Blastocatellia bacterium]|jgi:hypothetical protein